MSTQNKNALLANEIIDKASKLPLESQNWLLIVAKGMAFAKKCIEKQKEERDDQRTA